MIQIIGLMIGAYIITRMLDMAGDKNRPTWVKIVAILCLLFVALLMVFLVASSAPSPALR